MDIFKRQIAEVPNVTQINPILDESVVKRGSRVFRNAVRWFKAGVSDRLTSAWPSTPIPADLIVERYQRTLVARSREQCANNDYGRNYLRLTHQNIVGPQGVMLQAQIRNAQGKLDNKLCDAVEQEWSNQHILLENQR